MHRFRQAETARKPPTLQHQLGRLADYSIWLFGAAVAASVITERALPFALIVAGVQILVRWLAYGRPLPRTPADWPIFGLALMGLLSLAVTARMDLTGPQVGRLLLGMALYYAVVAWAHSPARIRLIALGYCAVGLALALGALGSVDWAGSGVRLPIPASIAARFQILGDDTVNPNVMAGYLALLLPIIVGLPLFGWPVMGRLARAIHSLMPLAILPIMLLTQSRGALVAAGLGLLVLVALRWRWALILGLLLLMAGLLGLAFGGWQQFAGIVNSGSSIDGLPERMEIWSRGWYMIQDFPFTGIGMGSFQYVAELLYPFFLAAGADVPHAHNLLIQVAVDLGLPGLITYLLIFVSILLITWRALRTWRTSGTGTDLAGLAAGILASQVVIQVHGIFDAVTWGMVRPAVLIWAIWGTSVALWQLAVPQAPPSQQQAGLPASGSDDAT